MERGNEKLKTLEEIATMLDGVSWDAGHKSFKACCPAHDDRNASLSVSPGNNGGIVINCFAGCKTKNVLDSIGLSFKDISPKKQDKPRFDWNNIVARYYYRDGTRKLRDKNKNFLWQHKEDGDWKKGKYTPHILYKAGKESDKVYFCEGEKDADNVAALGICALSTDDGAKYSPKWYAGYNADIENKNVVCIPDNDEIGKAHMQGIAAELYGKARSVKVVDLCAAFPSLPEKGDISDVIDSVGATKTLELLLKLESNTPDWKPKETFLMRADFGGIGKEIARDIEYDKPGNPKLTIDNFFLFMLRDAQYQGVRFNEMTQRAEIHEIDADHHITIRPWNDADDAKSKNYFERMHDMYAPAKHDAALKILFDNRKYNPLKDIVEALPWDGENRCEHFLSEVLKAEDTEYTREVSRLLFAGGIWRLYVPGCKFDDIPVLHGKQGSGKSTIIQWLALHDDYSATTKNLSGDQKSVEAIQGAWIVELPELAAFRTTDIESLKAFCTKTFDKYRLPYDRNTSIFPRRCIFIGTTNNRQFLTDRTGNRRFYPVEVHSVGYDIYSREAEIRDYILQCWAEARERYKRGEMPPVADRSLLAEYQEKQNAAMEDDWRVGVIENYLSRNKGKGDLVCCKELFHNALYPMDENRQPAMKDSREIGEIMDGFTDWEKCIQSKPTPKYGKQRCWVCVKGDNKADLSDVFTA